MSQISLEDSSSQPRWVEQLVSYMLLKFSRPHTIIGTSLSVLGLYLIMLQREIVSSPSTPTPCFEVGLLSMWQCTSWG